jgi:hypothetical protein
LAGILLAFSLAIVGLVQPLAVHGAGYTGYVLDSEAGNTIGEGKLWDRDPGSVTAIGSAATPNVVYVNDNSWFFEFKSSGPSFSATSYMAAPAQLTVKRFVPAMTCTNTEWAFQVLEVPTYDGQGSMQSFAADFSVRCDGESAFIHGSIRVNSSFPTRLLRVSPASVTMPSTVVSETSSATTITIFNAGGGTIGLTPGSAVGPNPADFLVDDGCGTTSLGSGDTCVLHVSFAPGATTTRTATWSIPTNTFDATRTVRLSGYGLSPLTKINSGLVVYSRGGSGETEGVFRFEPSSMTATINDGALILEQPGWSMSFAPPDGDSLGVGTYAFTSTVPSGGLGGMSLIATGMACTGTYQGAFTVLAGPVVDTDGTVLQAAINFHYSCGTDPNEVQGWVRFHSDEPLPSSGPASYSFELSATTAQVGDTITITPRPVGADLVRVHRCVITFEAPTFPDLKWMQVSSDDCTPWTFTLPAGGPGMYRIHGYLLSGDSLASPDSVVLGSEAYLEVTSGGTAVPFETNYPVASWDPADVLTDPTPTYGAPQTIVPPDGLAGCELGWFGGIEGAWTRQGGSCLPWTFTVPEPTPNTVASMFGTRGEVYLITWSGTSAWTDVDPAHQLVGAKRGSTYNSEVPTFDGTGGSYASNLPAIFAGDARGNVFYEDDSDPHSYAPVIRSLASGSCTEVRTDSTVQIVSGACAGYTLPAPPAGTNSIFEPQLELRDGDGNLIAGASTSIGYALRLGSVDVTAPESTVEGVEYTIGASDLAGIPATWHVSISAAGSGTSLLTAAASWDASGAFNPSLGSVGDVIWIAGPVLTPGDYEVKATFTDVKGGSVTATTTLFVVDDAVAPSASAPTWSLAASTSISSNRIPVRLKWTGTDAESGIGRYELQQSTDSGLWATVSTSLMVPTLDRLLSSGHTYRFRIRAVDKAGNASPWKTGITFKLSAAQQSSSVVHYKGTWATSSSSTYWGGSTKSSSTKGSTVSYTFTGKSIAWIGAKGSSRGKAAIYINGVYKATVDLYSSTTLKQRLVWSANYSTSATRTLTIKVLGTSGRPRVDVDGFAVGR